MATIIARKRKDGSAAYRAEVRIMRDGEQVFKRVKTFDKKPHAVAWARELEALMSEPGTLERARAAELTTGRLIETYLEKTDAIKPLGRTRRKGLEAFMRSNLAEIPASELAAKDLVDYCQTRRQAGAGPATLLVDFGTLKTVFVAAKPVLGLDLNERAFTEARPHLVKLGLIGKGQTRTRRPTGNELDLLLAHCRKRAKHHSTLIPLADLLEFAIYSCMRQGEICRILWSDLDEQRRTVIVRDRKDPVKKEGNHQEIPLLGPAWDIAIRQPKVDERIFPYNGKSVSSAFTDICRQLGIKDLRYHDLRREGASRLFEMGYTVPEVATVTGHKDLNILWRVYTKIRPESLHGKFKNKQ